MEQRSVLGFNREVARILWSPIPRKNGRLHGLCVLISFLASVVKHSVLSNFMSNGSILAQSSRV